MNPQGGIQHFTCFKGYYADLKVAVTAAGAKLDAPIGLNSSNWMLAEKAVKILQIYEEATHETSGNYATAGIIISGVNT